MPAYRAPAIESETAVPDGSPYRGAARYVTRMVIWEVLS